LIGFTTKKKTTAAIVRNAITAVMKLPIATRPSPTLKATSLKSCFPPIAAMKGMITSPTSEVTTAPNAVPITTAIARSTTLPRRTKALNSRRSSISLPPAA
jgi:hypothetical protein